MALFRRRHATCLPVIIAIVVGHDPSARSAEPPATNSAEAPIGISLATLLTEMTDLSQLAVWPDPSFTSRQFSSYDRASKSPTEDWFANLDAGQFVRTEHRDGRLEFVMLDATGPGAVVRIWSANPMGTLRVYLDQQPKPVLEVPLADFLGGKHPHVQAPVACETSGGWNSYLPIPYARHCKITCDRGAPHGDSKDRMYYHVNYRTYAPGTRVTSLAPGDLASTAEAVRTVAMQLSNTPLGTSARPRERPASARRLEPGDTWDVSMHGKEAGRVTLVSLRLWGADMPLGLRQTVLSMSFDGMTTVTCPVGDFFGAAPGEFAYESFPMSIATDGWMRSRWHMPYERSAVLSLNNRGRQPVWVECDTSHMAGEWTTRTMHFHAGWRAAREVPTRPMIDWNYLRVAGQGVFVGTSFSIGNPSKTWWGEGDEKIYCDGETFPSTFGTGTEDYFGYAWCSPKPFQHAYHNQPRCDGPGNYGYTSVNRWHLTDRIPFQRDIRFDMELWHWAAHCKVDMTNVCYWYARPGATDNYAALTDADLVVRPIPPYAPQRVAGALEGESMKVISCTGTPRVQDIDGCSGDQHLWWHGGQKPGDTLTLAFNAEQEGPFRVVGRFLTARDYGIMRLAINDEPIAEPVDFYSPHVSVTPERALGRFMLKKGANTMTVTVSGANPTAVKQYMFGLDYLRLDAVK